MYQLGLANIVTSIMFLKMVKADRKRNGSEEMDKKLMAYCQKVGEKKNARKRKRVVEPRLPPTRYDAMDSDDDSACDVRRYEQIEEV